MAKLKEATVAAFEVDTNPGNISGLKTAIGVLLIAAAHSVDALNDIALLLPDYEVIEVVRLYLEEGIVYLERILEFLGSGFLSFGLIDKVRKFLKGIFG